MEQIINSQQQLQFKIGLVTFNSKKMDQDKLTMMNFNKIHELLSQWYDKQRYTQQFEKQSFFILFECKMINHKNLVKFIQKWQALYLHLSSIRQINQSIPTNYLNEIAHINFNRLTFLRITFSRLRNIEAIAFLDCPHLKKLLLLGNDITNMKPLLKIKFKQLQQITIIGNLINEIKGIGRLSFDQSIQSFKLNCTGQSAYQKGYPQNYREEYFRGCNNQLFNLAEIYGKIKNKKSLIQIQAIIKDILNCREQFQQSCYVQKVCQKLKSKFIFNLPNQDQQQD